METLVETIGRRIERLLRRRRVLVDEAEGSEPDLWAGQAPALAGLAAASVQGRSRSDRGRHRGPPLRRLTRSGVRRAVAAPVSRGAGGLDLDAGVLVPADDRARLERVCRYAVRPPIAQDRIRLTGDGDVLLELRHRWCKGADSSGP